MKFELFNYQEKIYQESLWQLLNTQNNIAVQLATRGGKSPIMSKLIEYLYPAKIAFVAHKKILISQMSEELEQHGIKHGILAAGYPMLKYRVQVISKDTLVRRVDKLKDMGWSDFEYIFIDEAHRIKGKTYLSILQKYPNARVLGFSGTFERTDGQPFTDIFDHMIQGPQISYLQSIDRYAKFDIYIPDIVDTKGIKTIGGEYSKKEASAAVDKQAIYGHLPTHWKKYANGKKTLTFCSSIDHAVHVCDEFNKHNIPSVIVSSRDEDHIRNQKVKDYYSGKYINLVSVDLFIEGFHVRECECIVMARITKSLVVYLQTAGRAAMTYPGKSDVIYLDCVGNCLNPALGLPDDDREWSLDGRTRAKEKAKLKRCPACLQPIPVSSRTCPKCGHLFVEVEEVGTRQPEEREGELINIKDRKAMNKLELEIARNCWMLKQAINTAKKYGVSHKQAFYIWTHKLKNKA